MLNFSSLSSTAKYLVYAGGAAVLAGVTIAFYPSTWWIVLLGMAVIGLLLISFKLLLTLRDRKRGKQTNQKVLSASQGRGSVTDATDQAALDDLQKKFSRGVDTLDSLGLDLYALPWFVIVGQPASGKTEAIRRCKIPFPPGLTDELQGTGGTVNMDWWFTNDAVILDTAGKMLFQEAGQGTSEEWVRFLKLVREARPHCPINGMLLVIPADSLISDSPEQLDQNAKTIATQLNLIQRTLGVRFPVFVLITKCDLITGFREFFDSLDDRRHQQMLGWSNPDPLDTPFDPAKVRNHLATVRQRLEKRRFQLIQDPVSTAGNLENRLDEVDRLFDFPEAMQNISEPLQRYLELIFSGSKLAPKPLFLRGIYFTSSIQKGSILDGVLAQAMGVSLDQLTESKPFERVRPLFLRDLFMDKIFAEGGLVTRADNTVKLKARRRRLVLGSIAVGAVLLIGLSLLGFRTFQKSIGNQGEVWTSVADTVASESDPGLVMETSPGSGVYLYNGDRDPTAPGGERPLDELPARTMDLAEQEIDVPIIFRLTSGLSGDLLRDERQSAHRNLVAGWIVRPLVHAAASRLNDKTDYIQSPEAVPALAQLVRLRTLSEGQVPVGPPVAPKPGAAGELNSPVNVGALLRLSIEDAAGGEEPASLTARKKQLDKLQAVLDASFTQVEERRRLANNALGDQISDKRLKDQVQRYLDAVTGEDSETRGPATLLIELSDRLIALDDAELELHAVLKPIEAGRTGEALRRWHTWSNDPNSEKPGFVETSDAVEDLLKRLGEMGYDLDDNVGETFNKAVTEELKQIDGLIRPLRNQLPASAEGEALPADLLALIEQKRDLYGKALRTRFGDIEQRLVGDEGLIELYVTQTRLMKRIEDGAPNRPASLLAEMYLTTDEFAPEVPEDLSLSGLANAIKKVDQDLDKTLEKVGAHTEHAKSGDAHFPKALDVCKQVLALRARVARTALVEAANKSTNNADTQAIRSEVARLAADAEAGDWRLPEIKLSAKLDPGLDPSERFKIDPAYHPEGVRAYFGDWSSVISAGGASADQVFAQRYDRSDEVRDLLSRMSGQLRPYILEYVAYWTDDVVQAAAYRPIGDWDKFLSQTGTIRVASLQSELSLLGEKIGEALKEVPTSALDEATQRSITDDRDKALLRLSASESATRAAEQVLDYWQGQGGLGQKVDEIRKMTPVEFQRKFLADLYEPEGTKHAFWSALCLDPLDIAADAGSEQYRQALADVEGKYKQFPLFNRKERDADKTLSLDELGDAKRAIEVLGGGAGGNEGPADTIGGGKRLGSEYDEINATLDRLCGRSALPEKEQQRIENLARIVAALTADDGVKVSIHLPENEAFLTKNKPAGWGAGLSPAMQRYRELDTLGQVFNLYNIKKDKRGITLPNGSLKLSFSLTDGGNKITVDMPFDKRWSAIDAYLPYGDEEAVKEIEGVLWVPLRLPPEPGKQNPQYYYMIGLSFDQDLPAPKDWPKN